MKKIYLYILFLAIGGLVIGCAAYSSHIKLPESPTISTHPQVLKKCILVSRFGAITKPQRELVPHLLQVLPEVLRQQVGFADVRLESEGKGQSEMPTLIIKGVVRNTSNAAVPSPLGITINFRHSSEVEFIVYDVSDVDSIKQFDEDMQTTVLFFDVTAAKKLFSGVARTTLKADYGAQADIPKLVNSVLRIAAERLSVQISNQIYEKLK